MTAAGWFRGCAAGLLIALLLGPLVLAAASEQTAGLAELRDWTRQEYSWRDRGGLPTGTTLTGPLTAHYNMAYGATVLGLNLRDGDLYYAVCASVQQDQLTALAHLGPLRQPVQWHSGPYHLAAGLGDRRLMVWLTAPRQYPRLLTASNRYVPNTPLSCLVQPPEPLGEDWERWTVTVVHQYDDFSPAVAVETVDGAGRKVDNLPLLDVFEPLTGLAAATLELGGQDVTWVLLADGEGVYSGWYDQQRGWRGQVLHAEDLSGVMLHLPSGPAPLHALCWYNDPARDYAGGIVQLIDLDVSSGQRVSVSWGASDELPYGLDAPRLAPVESTRSAWPLIALATDADVHLLYRSPDADPRRRGLQLSSVRLHYGARLAGGSGNAAFYPILGLAAAAHWRSGNPEIYWVQLGSDHADGGQLFSLSYQPPPSADR